MSPAFAVLLVLVVVLVAAFASRRSRFTRFGARHHLSRYDGLRYRVHPTHHNPGEAADAMATINRRTVNLLRHLRNKYRGSRAFPERAHSVDRLLARYNPDNLTENSPRDPSGDTSYTIGKGEVLALCLRERDPALSGSATVHDIHDYNTLMFVMVHELTHIAILEVDHPPRFWRAFKFMLEEAQQAGVLENVDYSRHPEEYCGMVVDYNPYFDWGLAPIK